MPTPLKIEYIPIDTLKPFVDNPREHSERNINDIKRSISRFGFTNPILVRREDNMIIAGHGRIEAATIEGLETVPVIYLDMSDNDAKLYSITDNRTSDTSTFDLIALKELTEALSDDGMEIEDSGFEIAELEALLETIEPEVEVEEDDFDTTPQEEAISQTGDLWHLGEHRLLCGDSTVKQDVERVMDGEKVLLCHADPPYGMGKESEGLVNDNLYREKLDVFQMAWWRACRPSLKDNASVYIWGNAEDLWRLWYVGGLKELERLTFRNQIIWDKPPSGLGDGQNNPSLRSFGRKYEQCLFFMLGEQGFNNNADNYWEGWEPIRSYLAQERKKMGWDVPTMKRIAGHRDLSRDHWTGRSQWDFPTRGVYEALQEAAKGDAFKRGYDAFKREYDELKRDFYETRAYFDNTHDNMTDVWDFGRVLGEERHSHPTPKPVEMIGRIIKSSSPGDGLVFEPFLGSGSTLIACEQLSRRRSAIEISPQYIDVAVLRYVEYVGTSENIFCEQGGERIPYTELFNGSSIQTLPHTEHSDFTGELL